MATGVEFEDPDPIPSVTVRVQLKSRLTIENIRLSIHAGWPLAASPSNFEVSSVGKRSLLTSAGL